MIFVDMQRISPEQYFRILAENMIHLWRNGYSFLGKEVAISITHGFLATRGIHVIEQHNCDDPDLAQSSPGAGIDLSTEQLSALIRNMQDEINVVLDRLKHDASGSCRAKRTGDTWVGLVNTLDEIHPDDRSVPASLADHGSLIYGTEAGLPKSLGSKVARAIKSGAVRAYKLGRESFILDVRSFPDAAVRRRLQSVFR